MRETTKSVFVKKPTLTMDRQKNKKCAHKTAVKVNKLKEKGGSTPYFFKEYAKITDPKQYLATIEAVGAELMRLVFNPAFSPKVRVVCGPDAEIRKPYVISKLLPEFTSAFQLPKSKLDTLIKPQFWV